MFRTAFVMENGKIGQKVLEDVLFDVERLQAGTFEEAKRAFLRPFNLAAAPLFRAACGGRTAASSFCLSICTIWSATVSAHRS